MDSDLITAIIALSGVVLFVVVSFIVSRGTSRYNYRQLFAKTVSESRNKWLNEMRGFISTMLAEVNFQPTNKTRTKKYWKARNEITLRLNLNEALHFALNNEILKLDCPNNANQNETINNIISISQEILKGEWEKVKKEAKGE